MSLATAVALLISTFGLAQAPATAPRHVVPAAVAQATATAEQQPLLGQGPCLANRSSDCVGVWLGQTGAITYLEVDGGDGCVAPTAETIASNEYPISRNLYIYVNNAKAEANPGLQAYVDFYVGEGLDTAVAEVGYVELTDAAKADVRAAWG